ncbi:SRPBCC family protein [Mesorhizobium sp. M1060]|uniref:SRPBCC family protein n=1 Tax=unclassified Mesorhizobium TaxID=325217 RepID=UPI0003CFC3ED|nr:MULTISPECIES: SRPBCC family protein [unclassified Mesorhizobium]ESZ08632.1 ATPase [Mesorhizobium sp. L2C089B000]WJI48757.1 SRPBCC family protein [Mesorhizobium sp. C089B]
MNQMAPVDGHSVIHSTFSIERTYPQSPVKVFHAFADRETVQRWRVEGHGFTVAEFSFDFRVGGAEVSRFSYQGGPEIRLDAQFQDIVPNQRIVFSYRMAIGTQTMSASLTTVELSPSGEGTRLIFTEQGVFFDGVDSAQGREEGTRGLLEALAAELSR